MGDGASKRQGLTREAYLLGAAVLFYSTLFSYLSIMRHLSSYLGDADFSIFNQGFHTALRYGMPFFNTFEGNSHFANHCSPIFYLILPFYALKPGIPTLAIIQSVALGLGAIPVFLIAREALGRFRGDGAQGTPLNVERASLLFALLYLLYHPLHGINYDQFNELSLAVLPLGFALWFFLRGRMLPFWCCALVVLMCKEDAPFLLSFWGVYMIARSFVGEKSVKMRLHGAAIIAVSALWLYGYLYHAVPFFKSAGQYGYFAERYGDLGSTLPQVLHTMLTRPFYVLAVLLQKERISYFLEMFLPLALLPFGTPGLLWMTVPTFGINMLSNIGYMHNTGARYSAYLIPFIFAAGAFTLGRLACRPEKGGIFRVLLRGLTTPAERGKRLFKILFTLTVLCTLLLNNTPLRAGFRIPRITDHQRIVLRLARALPPDASVSTQIDIFQHVSGRLNAWSGWHEGSDYIFVDSSTKWYAEQACWNEALPKALATGAYEKLFEREDITLYGRKGRSDGFAVPGELQ